MFTVWICIECLHRFSKSQWLGTKKNMEVNVLNTKYKKCLEKITLVSDCVTTCFLNCDCDGRVFFLSFVSQYHTVFTYRHMEVPNHFSATELLLVQKHYKIKCCT